MVNEKKSAGKVTEEALIDLVNPAKSNLLVFGHGGCGLNAIKAALKKYDPETNPYLSFAAIESNRRVLASSSVLPEGADTGHLAKWLALPERFRKIQLGSEGLGAGGDMQKGEDMAKLKIEEIEEYIAQFDNAVLIGGGGGTCGSMPVIAEALNRLTKPTYAILTMPRLMEGPKKAAKAKKIRDRMLELCPTTLVENEHIPNKTLSYSGVWNEINEGSLFWILWLLKALLQDEGDVIDLDGSDWRTATSVGKFTVPGFYDASRGLDGLEVGLLGNPYLNATVLRKALAVDFWFEGRWPVQDIDCVVELIRSKMEPGERDAELELKWGIREKGVPDGTKTVGFVAFAEEGPEATSGEQRERTNSSFRLGELQALPAVELPSDVYVPTDNEAFHGEGGTNGFPAPPTAAAKDDTDDGPKVKFVGVVDGEQVTSEATPDLVAAYSALFVKAPSLELYRKAEEVQKRLKDQTGMIFHVPVRPDPPSWR